MAIAETKTAIPRDAIGKRIIAAVTQVILMILENGAVIDAVKDMKTQVAMKTMTGAIA